MKTVRPLFLLVVAGAALSARAGMVLRMDNAAPGSDDVVVTWAADASAPGPYALLRREVPPALRVADALPLDPVGDAFLTGLAGPAVTLPNEAAPGAEGTFVYQLVDAAGGCSNAGYVVRLPPSLAGFFPVAWPGQAGLHDARAAMLAFPQITRIVRLDTTTCRPRSLARDGSGAPVVGRNFPLGDGAGVHVHVPPAVSLVLVGASLIDPPALALRGPDTDCAPAATRQDLFGLSPATQWTSADELLCGVEGVDWVDANSDGRPDTCTGGLFGGAYFTDVGRFFPERAINATLSRTATIQLGSLRFTGTDVVPMPGHAMIAAWSRRDVAPRLFADRDAGDAPACRCPDTDGDGRDDCTELLDGTDPADATSFGPDLDADGVRDALDDCPLDADPAQADADGDAQGDACDPCPSDAADACVDPDADGVEIPDDNCPGIANADQADADGDGVGDACDNCQRARNPTQADADADSIGDACDHCPADGIGPDGDLDGCPDALDNCPVTYNNQADADADGAGDACDPCDASGLLPDSDGDGCGDADDSCPLMPDDGWTDGDGDHVGDVCDNCPAQWNHAQDDADADGVGDACDCADRDRYVAAPSAVADFKVARLADPVAPGLALTWRPDVRFPLIAWTWFDVVGGALAELRADRGFARAQCVAHDLAVPLLALDVPSAATWYLVRERADCGAGTYGTGSMPDRVNRRARLDDGVPADCP